MNNLLITASEFKAFNKVPFDVHDDKIVPHIQEAQNTDLYDVLGYFLFDVLSNVENKDYSDLINGGSFELADMYVYQCGLKKIVSMYAYSRFLIDVNTNITAFGSVTKSNDNSIPTPLKVLQAQSKQVKIDANIKLNLIYDYLEKNKDTFFNFKKTNNSKINTHENRIYNIF